MNTTGAGRAAIVALQGMLSFRVLMALTTSFSVTAAVAGPMAYQAHKARSVVVASAPTTIPITAGTTTTAATVVVVEPTTTTTTTTPATTTTITAAVPPGPAATTATTTTAPPLSADGLFVSVSADHRRPIRLDGSRVRSQIWIFFDGTGVTSVTYWVDDPAATGRPTTTTGPFDLSPTGIDARVAFGLGTHTVLAEVTTADGGVYRRLAAFDVVG